MHSRESKLLDVNSKNGIKTLDLRLSKAARALLGWTQEDLAQIASLNIGSVKDYEAGRRKPTKQTLLSLLQIYKSQGIEFNEVENDCIELWLRSSDHNCC